MFFIKTVYFIAEADEKLKMQNLHMASVSSGPTLEEQQLRLAAIASIDGDDFLPQEFKSSKSEVRLYENIRFVMSGININVM